MVKRRFNLSFNPRIVNEPLTFKMVKEYDLLINILRADITENGGRLLVEIEGKPAQITKGIEYLENKGVDVQELNEYVSKDITRCTNCGMCISICPADAIEMDHNTWVVEFHMDRCIACGLCVTSCPPQAMKLKV